MKIREVFSIMKEWIGRICLWRRFKLQNGLFNRLLGSVALIPWSEKSLFSGAPWLVGDTSLRQNHRCHHLRGLVDLLDLRHHLDHRHHRHYHYVHPRRHPPQDVCWFEMMQPLWKVCPHVRRTVLSKLTLPAQWSLSHARDTLGSWPGKAYPRGRQGWSMVASRTGK